MKQTVFRTIIISYNISIDFLFVHFWNKKSKRRCENIEGIVKFQWHLDLNIEMRAELFESECVCVCVREHNHILHGNRNMILHGFRWENSREYFVTFVCLMINHMKCGGQKYAHTQTYIERGEGRERSSAPVTTT